MEFRCTFDDGQRWVDLRANEVKGLCPPGNTAQFHGPAPRLEERAAVGHDAEESVEAEAGEVDLQAVAGVSVSLKRVLEISSVEPV